MIQKIGAGAISINRYNNTVQSASAESKNTVTKPSFDKNYTATSLVNAYQAYHGINTAKTISFGTSLTSAIQTMRHSMVTCKDETKGKEGEPVGTRTDVSKLINEFHDDLPNMEDAIKTNIVIDGENTKKYVDARTQIKRTQDGIMYDAAVRQARDLSKPFEKKELQQQIKIIQDPDIEGIGNIQERAYVLNTKNKLMAVVEDGDDVLLTN